ncbi:MAG: 5-dehydro-4-deoxyglucarate dehydratase [Rhizobiales bacterium]|nr:5-dehydro-4-deoxyglucarate dehydratase [Hyphomicrobiales bacterium]
MTKMTPREMAQTIGSGLLSFPVTPFRPDFGFDEERYRSNLDWLCGYEVAGLFSCGGTGEFFSLTPAEVARIVGIAANETKGRVPVLAGVGYGTAIATELAAEVERAGADGILLLPPYLVNSEQAGLAAHVEAVCAATRLGVIVYNRDNAILTEDTLAGLCARCPNLVGYKDGVGDIELMQRIRARMGDRLTYVGGLPTAETFALPYLEMGVTTYSSAVFNFVPEFSTKFYAAVRQRDRATVQTGLNDFILPLIAIRNRRKGYAVSIIKADMKVVGRDSGPVRTPLTDLTAGEMDELSALVAGLAQGDFAQRPIAAE